MNRNKRKRLAKAIALRTGLPASISARRLKRSYRGNIDTNIGDYRIIVRHGRLIYAGLNWVFKGRGRNTRNGRISNREKRRRQHSRKHMSGPNQLRASGRTHPGPGFFMQGRRRRNRRRNRHALQRTLLPFTLGGIAMCLALVFVYSIAPSVMLGVVALTVFFGILRYLR